MTVSVTSASIADRLAEEIGSSRVVAALFSTYTFRREFFERVPLPLVTSEGRRRGFLPITVIVDQTQFEGSGWGYEVVRAPGGRLWHAKLSAIMVEQDGYQRTIFAIGSGNLTRSGWERNQELYFIDSWWGWRLPHAVAEWLRTPWLRESAFARWARAERLGKKRRRGQSVVGSLREPLWEQLGFVRQNRQWDEIHIVSPFGDADGENVETPDSCGSFFDTVLEHAGSDRAKMTVYLRATSEDGNKGYADPAILKRVAKHVNLSLHVVPARDGRFLHAKLLAARCKGKWSALVGSPNATGPAFIAAEGNIELACEFRNIGRVLPLGLLPSSRRISLKDIVRPEMTRAKPRWECLESAKYNPRKHRITLRWKRGHGLFDTRVLLEDKKFDLNNVHLAQIADRFLKTIPIGSANRKYDPGFVPIEVPDDKADILDSAVEEFMTADDWLERLDGLHEDALEEVGGGDRSEGKRRERKALSPGFHWRDRVVLLTNKLNGLDAAIDDAFTAREIDHLRQTVMGVWSSHDPSDPGLTSEMRTWFWWVRAGVWQILYQCDQRDKLWRPLSSLAARWKKKIPSALREFDIGY